MADKSDDDSKGASAGPRPADGVHRSEQVHTGTPKPAPQSDPTWRTVSLNLAVAYAVAIIFTTYLSPPNDLTVLMLGPLLLVAVSAIFGLAVVGILRLRKLFSRRFPPRRVWLLSTWIALMVSLVDPFLPTPTTQSERTQEPANEFRRGGAR